MLIRDGVLYCQENYIAKLLVQERRTTEKLQRNAEVQSDVRLLLLGSLKLILVLLGFQTILPYLIVQGGRGVCEKIFLSRVQKKFVDKIQLIIHLLMELLLSSIQIRLEEIHVIK